jgi:hypothetical protein
MQQALAVADVDFVMRKATCVSWQIAVSLATVGDGLRFSGPASYI